MLSRGTARAKDFIQYFKTCPGSIYQYRLTADYVVSARRPHRHNLNHTHHSFSFCDYNILYFWKKVNQSLTYFRLEVPPCGGMLTAYPVPYR